MVVVERTRSESLREKCLFSVATLRPAPVEGRLTDNCTVPASRLYTLRRQTGTYSDTSVSCEICKLTDVSRILEQNHVVGTETHGSRKLVFRKQVLGKEDVADISVVRSFREHVGDRIIGLLHEIVDNQQRRFSAVKISNVRKSLAKLYSQILTKQFLLFSVTVDDFCGWRIYGGWRIIDESNTKRVFPQDVGPATMAVNG